MLNAKNILIGVTGSIAAYKIPILVRLLKKAGANVRVIMTESAKDFVTPLSLSTVSDNPVLSQFYKKDTGEWNSHVALAEWADIFVIAPLSANSMGKMVNGIADNLLLTTYLSARSHVMFAPAMDLDMYKHPSTKKNIEVLKSWGHSIIEPTEGELASGLCGAGRMEEPENIVSRIQAFFDANSKLKAKKILVTAGPTYEAIDPVRFIGNHSSGKMGFAIAEQLANNGAEVYLVAGPVSIDTPKGVFKRIDVTSAEQMYGACNELFEEMDVAIMSAAVADFRPKLAADQKIKKGENVPEIELLPTTDILKTLGERKKANQILVGFALETENEVPNAMSKLKRKNLDFIVLNSTNDKGATFGTSTNKITIIDKFENAQAFELKSKQEVAKDIVSKLESFL
jgi:phosphopantothenoylcysteine decarboxylase/phosphopantothenate--cysteine ligase